MKRLAVTSGNRVEVDNPGLGVQHADATGNITSLKSKFDATVNPSGADDFAAGYSIGSTWINTTAGTVWTCVGDGDWAQSGGDHTHTLDDISDVTATAGEVNLLDLDGLSAGWVLRATGASSAAWGAIQASDLPTHTHSAADITSGTLVHERGGLETDVSAYSGLVKISGGATSQAVEGTDYYGPGGTDVAITDGGTGASTAAAARTSLGLEIGNDVQAHDADLDALAAIDGGVNGDVIYYNGGWARLPKGSDAQVLTLASGLPSWADAAGGGVTASGSPAQFYVARFTGASDITGTADFYYDSVQEQFFCGIGAGNPGTSTGDHNICFGQSSGLSISSGFQNIFQGHRVAQVGTVTGARNTALNNFSLYSLSSGGQNIAIGGQYAGFTHTSGNYCIYIGTSAGRGFTTAHQSIFIGLNAGYTSGTGTGADNLGVGYNVCRALTSGQQNSVYGYSSGSNISSGSFNSLFGHNCGDGVTTGSYNLFSGHRAGGGGPMTGNGYNCGYGPFTLYSTTSGQFNFAAGYQAGYSNLTGSKSVFIGYQAGYNETNSNRLYIHYSNSANPLIYGEFDNGLLKINGDLHVNGDVGFYNTTPVAQATGYTTFTNLSSDRTLDANSTTVEELADVLGTLIEDLKATGLIAA